MDPERDGAGVTVRRRTPRALDVAILIVAGVALALAIAAARLPRFVAAITAGDMAPQGGRAFAFDPGFRTRWPFVLPSHPASTLRPGDVVVTEDGQAVGALIVSHDEIRQRGAGRYDLWDGKLWFSSDDGADPREDGRRYGVRVKARLSGSAALALAASLALLAALASARSGTAFGARPAEAWRAGRSPPAFGGPFALFCAAMLGLFGWNFAARPMPLLFGDDSFTFVLPGVLWNAGESVAGQSTRDVGYAALTALALRLGSLGAIPPLQLAGVLTGVAALLGVLYLMLASVAARLRHVPVETLTCCACAIAAAYGLMLAGNDAFVVDIYRALAEALHLLPTALSLLFLVLGLVINVPSRRLASMVLAAVAADLSVAVKPHSSLVLALCVLALAATALRDRRAFRSPAILGLCVVSAGLVASVHRFDAYVTPAGFDFGPKLLFCNHLDVAEPVFDASTPERARVKEQIESTLRHPHPDWPLLGYHGDTCTFGDAFNRAMVAAARAEGVEPPTWMEREFARAALRNPLGYARAVWKQVAFVLADPIVGTDGGGQGVITDQEWRSLEPYAGAIRMPRDAFETAVTNWVSTVAPPLSDLGKTLLGVVSATFTLIVLGATLAATVVLVRRRARGDDTQAEVVLLSVAAFSAAFVLTPALAHTFDVHRYLTDVLPFMLLWWVIGIAYGAHGLALATTRLRSAPALSMRQTPAADAAQLSKS